MWVTNPLAIYSLPHPCSCIEITGHYSAQPFFILAVLLLPPDFSHGPCLPHQHPGLSINIVIVSFISLSPLFPYLSLLSLSRSSFFDSHILASRLSLESLLLSIPEGARNMSGSHGLMDGQNERMLLKPKPSVLVAPSLFVPHPQAMEILESNPTHIQKQE